MANTYISRETAGSLYRTSLIKKGITDARLLDGMVEDFLRTQYDNGRGIEAYPSSGSSAYNFNNQKAVPYPGISGSSAYNSGGQRTAANPSTKDDAYIPLRESRTKDDVFASQQDFGNGTNVFTPGMQTGISLNSVPPVATIPTPNMRPQGGAPARSSMGGFDPLPQTSGHVDVTSRSGQESMSPAQAALLEKLMAAQRMV
jgi:hypothetical protein